MSVRKFLVGTLLGVPMLVGCVAQNESTTAHRDTGIGSEAGRLVGSEAAEKTPYLGGQIGSLLGRQAERGVANSADKQSN
jgi:hypothetical protein